MNRDSALILKILRCIRRKGEEAGHPYVPAPDFVPQYSENRVEYHLELCVEAGFLKRHAATDMDGPPETWSLTWSGHDWLEKHSDC